MKVNENRACTDQRGRTSASTFGSNQSPTLARERRGHGFIIEYNISIDMRHLGGNPKSKTTWVVPWPKWDNVIPMWR